MRRAARFGGWGLALACALLAATAPAAMAKKTIRGKLSEPGYTVMALNPDGTMTSADAEGRFRLRTTAEKVTLHLRGPDGKYAGPIVVGGGGKRVILGVKAGASIGSVTVHEGYASVANEPRKRILDTSRTARAKGGVPLGAGVFGRVRSSIPRKTVRGDPDLDGIPNQLDIDDDGDLTLDDLDRSKKRRSARTPFAAQEVDIEWGYELTLGATLVQTRNANAPGVTDEEIDSFLARRGDLVTGEGIQESATGESVRGGSFELDCGAPQSPTDPTVGGLVYCTRGGTGRVPPSPGAQGDRNTWPRFPDDFDSDNDGFGTLSEATSPLSHGATSTQISTGDTLIARVAFRGAETKISTVLQYVPATPQALVSYDDGQGVTPVQYPVPGPDADGVCIAQNGPPCGMWPGSQGNPLPVIARPNGQVTVTFTLWRPQRRPIGEGPRRETCLDEDPPCEWIDIGGLEHSVGVGGSFPGDQGSGCLGAAYSESDPNLEIVFAPPPDPEDEDAVKGAGWLLDKARDARANPASTFTYTVNLSECLRPSQPTDAWPINEARQVVFGSAEGAGGVEGSGASHSVWFQRVPPPSP
jgi:hypothetical protein